MINIFVLVTILGHLPVILSAKSKGSEVSRLHVARLSSARDNLLFKPYQNGSKTPENQGFPGFSYT